MASIIFAYMRKKYAQIFLLLIWVILVKEFTFIRKTGRFDSTAQNQESEFFNALIVDTQKQYSNPRGEVEYFKVNGNSSIEIPKPEPARLIVQTENLATAAQRMSQDKVDINSISSKDTGVDTLDKMTRYFSSYGVEIAKNTNPEYFEMLANGENITSKMTTDFSNSVLEFVYKPFQIDMPHFATSHDKEVFLKDERNHVILERHDDPKQLRGHFEFILEGSAHEKYDCGWQKNLSPYRLSLR